MRLPATEQEGYSRWAQIYDAIPTAHVINRPIVVIERQYEEIMRSVVRHGRLQEEGTGRRKYTGRIRANVAMPGSRTLVS